MEHPQGHCDVPRGNVGIFLALETAMSFKLAPFLLGTAWQSITSFLPGKGFELKFPLRFLDVTDTNWSSQCFSFLWELLWLLGKRAKRSCLCFMALSLALLTDPGWKWAQYGYVRTHLPIHTQSLRGQIMWAVCLQLAIVLENCHKFELGYLIWAGRLNRACLQNQRKRVISLLEVETTGQDHNPLSNDLHSRQWCRLSSEGARDERDVETGSPGDTFPWGPPAPFSLCCQLYEAAPYPFNKFSFARVNEQWVFITCSQNDTLANVPILTAGLAHS